LAHRICAKRNFHPIISRIKCPFAVSITSLPSHPAGRYHDNQDKDEFQTHYRKHLMRRMLLKGSSYNEDREQRMVGMLKACDVGVTVTAHDVHARPQT
jgi:hypothetical protein